ncbi:MAG TPA: hypothetical protein VE268_03135 [Herpetosiphonaceae bacterium]|nr:hypothetical protein [Herpetosiphonaceae bacterium]
MELTVRSKFWVEQAGELVLSDWRIELLEAIDDTGSLTAGCARLNVAYRVGWGKIKEIERRLGMHCSIAVRVAWTAARPD